MKILISYRMITFGKDVVYGINSNYRGCFLALLDLNKPKDSQVDVFMVNSHLCNNLWKSYIDVHTWTQKFVKEKNYDYLLIVDPDMILPRSVLVDLIGTKGDVVCALVPERPSKIGGRSDRGNQPPNGWHPCMPWNNNKEAEQAIKEGRVFHMAGCGGFACVLLNRKAIEQDGLFDWTNKNNGPDFSFWENARRNKLITLCNPKVICKHMEPDGTIIEGPKHA